MCKAITRSSLLKGGQGLNLLSEAEQIAAGILNTDISQIRRHPDFCLIQPQEGKRSIVLEDVLPVFELVKLIPMQNNFVVIIDGMNLLGMQAANKLLKIIEDNSKLIVLGVCYGDVMQTLESRMQSIYFYPKGRDAYLEYGDDADIYYAATRGRKDIDISDILDILKTVKRDIEEDKAYGLLQHLHLLKEKDTLSFYTCYPKLVIPLLNVMEMSYLVLLQKQYKEHIYQNIVNINMHKQRCQLPSYSKDDFFSLFVSIIGKEV